MSLTPGTDLDSYQCWSLVLQMWSRQHRLPVDKCRHTLPTEDEYVQPQTIQS